MAIFPAALFSLEDGSTTAKRPRRHPTWRRPVPVWRSRTRRHRRLDAYAGPDPSQALPGESFSMGPKRKRPPSGVLILTTGRTDQIAHDLVFTQPGSFSDIHARCRKVRFTPKNRHRRPDPLLPKSASERTRFRGRGWRRGRAITSAAVTL